MLRSHNGGHLVCAVTSRQDRTTEANRNMSSVHVFESKHLFGVHWLSSTHKSFLLSPFICLSPCKPPPPSSHHARARVKGL